MLSRSMFGPSIHRPRGFWRSWILILLVVLTGACLPIDHPPTSAPIWRFEDISPAADIKQGIAVTEVTSHSALVWVRTEVSRVLHVQVLEVMTDSSGSVRASHFVSTTPGKDFIDVVSIKNLTPQTKYAVQVFLGQDEEPRHRVLVAKAEFSTPPIQMSTPVTFVWGGDLGGQGYCRKPNIGYPIFDQLRLGDPDFGILLGDLIYGDGRCPTPSNLPGSDFIAKSLEEFRAKHRYQREDLAFQKFLANVPVYAMWDDHEARNDFSGSIDPLLPASRQAFLQYWPIDTPSSDPNRLYRLIHRGPNLDVFFLDTRQYRSANHEVDGVGKSMLGQEQLEWIMNALKQSAATWKIIVSSVPLSLQKGGSRLHPANDSWAVGRGGTGFALERDQIVNTILLHGVPNVVWLSTDVHFAQATAYDPNKDGRPDFYEFICGPLSAKPFKPWLPETSLNPSVLYQEGGFFNFGQIVIEENLLQLRLIDEEGKVRFHYSIPTQA